MPIVMNLMMGINFFSRICIVLIFSSCGVQNYYKLKDLDAQILSEKKKSLTVIKKWHIEAGKVKTLRDSLQYYRRLNVPQK
jgi:hypothetical protein